MFIARRRWLERWGEASAPLTARDAVNGLLDDFLSERLGASADAGLVASESWADELSDPLPELSPTGGERTAEKTQTRSGFGRVY